MTAGRSRVSPAAELEGGRARKAEAGEEAFDESRPRAPQDASVDSDWRNIVSAKVKRYQRLRPRKQRYPSLAFDFDLPACSNPGSRVPPGGRAPILVQPEPAPSDPPGAPGEGRTRVRVQAAQEATARVLEFPRPGMLPFNRDELAEPVVVRPRIVEAPELVPAPPALGGILIGPEPEPAPERSRGVDAPLRAAPFSRRALAAALDGMLVALALASFPCVFAAFQLALPDGRSAAEFAALLALLLWFAFQGAFTVFSGKTPGMRAAHLTLARFDGTPVPRNLRRWRVAASVLSGISLGLGYAWCFFDEDRLSWHDRITKTHLAADD